MPAHSRLQPGGNQPPGTPVGRRTRHTCIMRAAPFALVCVFTAAVTFGQGFPGQYPPSPFPGGRRNPNGGSNPTGGPNSNGGPVGGGPSRSGRNRGDAV